MNTALGVETNSAGGAFQKDLQNQYTDQQNHSSNRDFEMDQYAKYMSGILGRAPTQGKNYTKPIDPTSATIGDCFGGFEGLGGQLSISWRWWRWSTCLPAQVSPSPNGATFIWGLWQYAIYQPDPMPTGFPTTALT